MIDTEVAAILENVKGMLIRARAASFQVEVGFTKRAMGGLTEAVAQNGTATITIEINGGAKDSWLAPAGVL